MDKHEVWKALEENLLNLPWIDEIDSHEGFPGGGVPYELKIRCAQFMGSYYNEIGIDEIQLKKLAESDNWTDRLVCGWTIKDNNSSFAKEIKAQLENDEFQDDNGFFLVRESIGIDGDDDFF